MQLFDRVARETSATRLQLLFCYVTSMLLCNFTKCNVPLNHRNVHRLNFIRASDKILVLNTGGTVNAFDTPENLLKDTDGYFARQMAAENSGCD